MCDATFTLSGAISSVGNQAQLNTNAVSLWEGWQKIVQAITKWWAEARRPGHPSTYLPAFLPFSFCNQDEPLQEERPQSADECMEEPRHTHHTSHHDWSWTTQCSWDHGQRWQEPWAALSPSPSLDHGFKSDRSSMSTSWSVSSIDLGAPGVCTMVDAVESQEAIWKSICQSSKMQKQRMPSIIKVGIGI